VNGPQDGSTSPVQREPDLPQLWDAIVKATAGNSMFWIGEMLLNEITKETGYAPSGAAPELTSSKTLADVPVDETPAGLQLGDSVEMSEGWAQFYDMVGVQMKIVSLRLDPDGVKWASGIEREERHRGHGIYDGEITDIDTRWLKLVAKCPPLAESDWQPIATAPKDAVAIVCTKHAVGEAHNDDGRWYWSDDPGQRREIFPTLWQNLPKRPASSTEHTR